MQHLQISEHETEITELAIQTVLHQQSINEQRKGTEFYRKPYDLALHIVMALKARGFRISVSPFETGTEREVLSSIRKSLPLESRDSEHLQGMHLGKLGIRTKQDALPKGLRRRAE